MVILAVKMVADVTKIRNVIPNLEFKTCMTINSISVFSIFTRVVRTESFLPRNNLVQYLYIFVTDDGFLKPKSIFPL